MAETSHIAPSSTFERSLVAGRLFLIFASVSPEFATARDWSRLVLLHHKWTTTADKFLRSQIAESSWNRLQPSKAGDTSGFRLRGRVWLLWSGGGKHSSAWTNQTRPATGRWTQHPCVQLPQREKAVRQQWNWCWAHWNHQTSAP